ncbi:hypothetical protein GLAREA_05730 [Glarea lozoyensis ATCC 20868]|uniref:Heterokaryon incompatibility domain-containing protein n=1 Tax=Glarea lozoyensis (strain ATCC 20868 / MF5171) TaxID=1116229 RepID=S3DDB4_GLAL2|nr:uncharacterized protein GLAREA_05730 [Glarea lozoyensis ATCC 20868]EPE36392.1 hypothetical protein GLAREA_05730 [Glarea lozoyensis ATCC 20868]
MSTHSYQPLTPRQFRVLRLLPGAYSAPIETTLRHVNLEDKPKFDALSYQWGPESSNNSQILVDKTPFTIRDNLFLFLKRFRASSQNAQELYIDALCINQQDVGEKGHQVAMMSEIYPRAKKVLVWLGEHDEHSQKIFAGAGFQDWVSAAVRVFKDDNERLDAWTSLLSRDYWNRTWIVQEFLLARSIVVYCGPDHMSGDSFFSTPLNYYFMSIMQKNKRKKLGQLDGIPRSFLLYFWKQNQKPQGLFSRSKTYFPGTDIFQLAFNFQYTECQNALDHVFGLMALEDPKMGPRIISHYDVSAQKLFIEICVSKLAKASRNANKVTDEGVCLVVMLFRGLNLTCDNAEEVVDILLDNKLVNNNTFVIATIATAFDQFGFLKPERKSWILPQTKTRQPAEQLVADIRSWRTSQKDSGNWYTLHSIPESHQPPGMQFQQLDEPLWSQYSTLRNTMARKAAAVNALGVNNMNNMNNMNSAENIDYRIGKSYDDRG